MHGVHTDVHSISVYQNFIGGPYGKKISRKLLWAGEGEARMKNSG